MHEYHLNSAGIGILKCFRGHVRNGEPISEEEAAAMRLGHDRVCGMAVKDEDMPIRGAQACGRGLEFFRWPTLQDREGKVYVLCLEHGCLQLAQTIEL